MDNILAAHYDKVFVNCKNLKKLIIQMASAPIPPSATNAIRCSLKNNIGLRKLGLTGGSIFKEDFSSEIGFKLKEFYVRIYQIDQLQTSNLNLLLATQKESLRLLMITHIVKVETLKAMSLMPGLKKVYLKDLSIDRASLSHNISPNNSVKKLQVLFGHSHDVQVTNYKASNIQRSLELALKLFPHVELLEIPVLDDKIAEVISNHGKSLKHLKPFGFRAENISNEAFYLALAKLESKQLHDNSIILFIKLNGMINEGRWYWID